MSKRWLSSNEARRVRQAWHDDALTFALLIWMDYDYQNDPVAKKDVIDPSWDAHSLKSWAKKWQIFLYWVNRFKNDDQFAVMNGMGQFLIDCIEAFPPKFTDYIKDKASAKEKCRIPMRKLCEKLQNPVKLKWFLHKAIFNWWEVNYLTIKHEEKYHVFEQQDVLIVLRDNFTVENSQARAKGQFPEQKVILKHKWLNVGEIEMRNDSVIHYRQIRFNMIKPRFMDLLFENFTDGEEFFKWVLVYGSAKKKFGRWKVQTEAKFL